MSNERGRAIGVRELRTHLCAYLRAVARGETVTIGNRRGEAVARLVPVERSSEDEHFERLAREGRITLPTGPKPGRFRGVTPRKGAKLVSDIVIEDRGVTVYLDTSALVKLYVAEAGTTTVRGLVDDARRIVTARITYVEARAAMARARRLGVLTSSHLRRATAELDAAWRGHLLVDITDALVFQAARLSEKHGLRGYDAVQLGAALEASSGTAEYCFASFDGRLNDAATREGLRLAPGPHDAVRDRGAGYRSRGRLRVAASRRSR